MKEFYWEPGCGLMLSADFPQLMLSQQAQRSRPKWVWSLWRGGDPLYYLISVPALGLSDCGCCILFQTQRKENLLHIFFFSLKILEYILTLAQVPHPVITQIYWLNTMRNEAAILCCVNDGVLFCVGSSILNIVKFLFWIDATTEVQRIPSIFVLISC